jgi:hypothetical protein
MDMVRTNLPLTDLHCQGTLALSVAETLTLLRSYYRQDSHTYEVHVPSRRRFCPHKSPYLPLSFSDVCSIGGRFSPVHFWGLFS